MVKDSWLWIFVLRSARLRMAARRLVLHSSAVFPPGVYEREADAWCVGLPVPAALYIIFPEAASSFFFLVLFPHKVVVKFKRDGIRCLHAHFADTSHYLCAAFESNLEF